MFLKNIERVGEQLIYAYYADSEEQRQHHQDPTSCYPACNDVLYSTQVYYSDLIKEPAKANADFGSNKTLVNLFFIIFGMRI